MTFRTNPVSPDLLTFKTYRTVAAAPDGSRFAARTACEIKPSNIKIDTTSAGVGVTTLDVLVSVKWTASWVIPKRATETLLDHERLHFIIAICVGRRFYDQVLAAVKPSTNDLQQTLNQLLSAHQRLVDEISRKYDDETEHGARTREQASWALRVRGWYSSKKLDW